jgi:hypothetical protein
VNLIIKQCGTSYTNNIPLITGQDELYSKEILLESSLVLTFKMFLILTNPIYVQPNAGNAQQSIF